MRQEHANPKTFAVSAMIGRLTGTPWPFGRLDIGDEAITVRTFFKEKRCPKSEVTDISLERLGPQYQLVFEDEAGKMADVTVGLAMRVKGVVGELRRRGYPVVDRRERILPLPQGIVPWRDQDIEEDGDEPPRR
jgi:hypothetical protein